MRICGKWPNWGSLLFIYEPDRTLSVPCFSALHMSRWTGNEGCCYSSWRIEQNTVVYSCGIPYDWLIHWITGLRSTRSRRKRIIIISIQRPQFSDEVHSSHGEKEKAALRFISNNQLVGRDRLLNFSDRLRLLGEVRQHFIISRGLLFTSDLTGYSAMVLTVEW